MKKVYIAHPLRGENRDKNVAEVTKICKKITELFPDVLPVSPIHAFSFLDNCGEDGEKKALELCLEMVKSCDELWLFGEWKQSLGCTEEERVFDGHICYFSPTVCREIVENPEMYSVRAKRPLVDWLLSEVYTEPEPPLKPCPFCGGAPILNEEQTFIACDNPDCFINPCFDWEIEPKINTKAEAIAAWNRRA